MTLVTSTLNLTGTLNAGSRSTRSDLAFAEPTALAEPRQHITRAISEGSVYVGEPNQHLLWDSVT